MLRSTTRHVMQVYSDGLMVQVATPDFSMPYNVICLSSTVLAVFFGAIFNTLVKSPPRANQATQARPSNSKLHIKLLVLLLVFTVAAVYLDPELQALVHGVLAFP